MRRPLGIIFVVVYFGFQAIICLLYSLTYLQTRPVAYWADVVGGTIFTLLAWGVFRLWEWARFTAMLVIVVQFGLTMPFYFFSVRRIDFSFFWYVTLYLSNLFIVWYLFRSATSKYFSRMLKTA